jgi:hypothetical protein
MLNISISKDDMLAGSIEAFNHIALMSCAARTRWIRFFKQALSAQKNHQSPRDIPLVMAKSKQLITGYTEPLYIACKPKPAFLPHYPVILLCCEVKCFQAIITTCENS